MKKLVLRLYSVLILALTIIIIPVQLKAVQNKETTRERAMNAAKQLRSYYQRIATESKKTKEIKQISNAPAQVSISINRSIRSGSIIYFYDNMESGFNGWTTVAYQGTDLWHQTKIVASSPVTSWWSAIESQGNYNTGERIQNGLISPVVNLTGATGTVRLLFTEKYCTEQGWDYCMVDATTDGGGSWTHLRGGYGSAPSGDSEGWIISSLDLTAYAGMNLQLRFFFDTGDSLYNEFPGWFVDDVVIFDQSGMITGKKFFDINNNSMKDIGERGIKNWLVTANGPISLTTKTNYRGRYWLPLPLGSYVITETPQPNWVQTYPISGSWTIDLATPDTLVDSIHFGNYTHASFINGLVFNDLDKNGLKDPTDTSLAEWKTILTDTLGNELDFDRSDSLGEYQIYVFEPGRYIVEEIHKKGWVQSYPVIEKYTIDIPDLFSEINDKDFGNYYSPITNGIMGQKFADRNRNGVRDEGEQGLAGVTINLLRKVSRTNFNQYKKTKTDSSGYYEFLSLTPDTYKVAEMPPVGWWQSRPDSNYVIALNPEGTFDTLNFGNYEIAPGSISGMKFHDAEGDHVKDLTDEGLSDWTIELTGMTFYNTSVYQSIETDGNGNYTFTGLWPGEYIVSEVFRENWRQTYPTHLMPHFIQLGPETNLSDIDFGNTIDSTFNFAFRTFLSEDFALAVDSKIKHKPIAIKHNKSIASLLFNPAGESLVDSVRKIAITFNTPPDIGSITLSKSGTIDQVTNNLIEITFDKYVQTTDTVLISLYTIKPKPVIVKKWWPSYLDSIGVKHQTNLVRYWSYCLPMPNAINVLQAGAGTMLKVGLGGPHSVVHSSYKYVIKSLVEGRDDRMHSGDARCLAKFTNDRSIKRELKYLTPTKGQNKLFAEAVALQANIKASQLGINPPGFGNLIFDEGLQGPLDGLTIQGIASKIDEYMSSYQDTAKEPQCLMPVSWIGLDPETLYTKIRMINGAFTGPIDTISFGRRLRLTAVKQLDDVPFLRLDSSVVKMEVVPTWTEGSLEPKEFRLEQNFPNPFNPSTSIEFYLTAPSYVTLKLYNTLGQEVATILNREELEDGWQESELDAGQYNLSSGVYYYRLIAETIQDEDNPNGQKVVLTKKMVLIK
jgi:SdrD B-like domain/Immune inhibitor A-like, MAM domain